MTGVVVHLGYCLEVMRGMPAEIVDAVVCDPPYGLAFMGHEWDHGVPGEPFWREALRVAKPGAHLVAFGGTRTYHRLACAIEDAGWEIRDGIGHAHDVGDRLRAAWDVLTDDQRTAAALYLEALGGGPLAWCYGSGFPKSMRVDAAIEKQRDDEPRIRVVCRFLRAAIEAHPMETVATIAAGFGFHPRMVEHWAARDTDSQPTVPTLEQWESLRSRLNLTGECDALVRELNARKGEFGDDFAAREITGERPAPHDPDAVAAYALSQRDGARRDRPSTDAGAEWLGWGTALKPAWEPIILARKPLAGTVAENVLAHGVGGLNVDGCRIAFAGDADEAESKGKNQHAGYANPGSNRDSYSGSMPPRTNYNAPGRWPANVILDPVAAAMLDGQSGERGGGFGRAGGNVAHAIHGGGVQNRGNEFGYGDTGGASRFYYCAKANRGERDAGLDEFPEQVRDPMAQHAGRRMGDDGASWAERQGRLLAMGRNPHPTVKPIDVMRWLCRLVTPPAGTVLDPFAGSGTTGCAAVLEGFGFIGIEREPDYVEIARRRIAHWERVALERPLDLFADSP